MRHHPSIKKPSMLYGIGIVGFFSALHLSMISYYNSSFLSTFTDEKTVSLIYLLVSIATIIGYLSINTVLQKIGNFRTSLLLIMAQIIIFYGIITANSFSVIAPLFILGMSMVSLIAFTIDVFLQKSTDVGHTGTIRGLYMTAVNAAWLSGPLLGGILIVGNNYRNVYVGGFLLLFPLLYLVYKNFNRFKDTHYVKIPAKKTFIRILQDKNISRIFLINIILHTFYAWMVIYTPIYLHNTIGFSWPEISVIFTIMLLPFILLQMPLGKLADTKLGEKEIMAMGFIIIGVTTATLVLFEEKNLLIWATMLFLTRVGAAAAEIMIETYFFKKVDGRDPEVLGMFRTSRPLSYFTAPLLTTIGLVYVSSPYLFVILGAVCLLALYPIFGIKDTD